MEAPVDDLYEATLKAATKIFKEDWIVCVHCKREMTLNGAWALFKEGRHKAPRGARAVTCTKCHGTTYIDN